MATVQSWSGTITDIGPLYPFVGSELFMVVVAGVLWLAWHLFQLKVEANEYEEEAARLRDGDTLKRATEREG
ncbi:MAG: hypothetical protein FJ164_00510 [Gammaproteobacteria bacterium]|nr:hypothetical protein [Gammaproteobacteria bacterium]